MDTKQFAKTGTTCVALKFNDGIILATDRRITAGYIVSDKFNKISVLGKKVAATWSGLLADAQLYSRVIKAEIKLHELKVEREIRVDEVANIANNIQYKHIRTPNPIEPVVGYLIGGYDENNGFMIFKVGAEGSLKEAEDFAVDGSGSIFIQGLLNNEYKKGINEKDAIVLVEKALRGAMQMDNASGGGVVMKIITENGIKEIDDKLLKSELVKG